MIYQSWLIKSYKLSFSQNMSKTFQARHDSVDYIWQILSASFSHCGMYFPDLLILGLAVWLSLANGMTNRCDTSIILNCVGPMWPGAGVKVIYMTRPGPREPLPLHVAQNKHIWCWAELTVVWHQAKLTFSLNLPCLDEVSCYQSADM